MRHGNGKGEIVILVILVVLSCAELDLYFLRCRFSCLLVVWWGRSLEYLTLVPSLQVPIFTISRASMPVCSIVVFIMMVTLSVSYGTTVVFGSTVESFTSLSSTIVTLIQAALGEIVLDGFSDELRFCTTGPLFVAIWAFVMM
jgi:hypothetical protein